MTEKNGVEQSTATDVLRRLLDECGVEWWQSANTLGCIFTRWYSPLFGDEVVAMENGEEGLVLFDHYITPEQAIAATLGSCNCSNNCTNDCTNGERTETCHDEGDPSDFCCSECGVRMFTNTSDTYTMIASDGRTIIKRPNYCPNCGRRCVG